MCPITDHIERLPSTIPIFPLPDVVLLPGGELPLHIFEPRYVAMFNDALRSDRLIGITQIQPDSQKLYTTGCVGRISAFQETDDQRYYATLSGLCRFKIEEEVTCLQPYRRFHVDWSCYQHDFQNQDVSIDDKNIFFPLLQRYFKKNGLCCNWSAVEQTPDKKLLTALSMICPFSNEEKQALLEAHSPCDRARILFTLLEIDAVLDCHEKNPQSHKH